MEKVTLKNNDIYNQKCLQHLRELAQKTQAKIQPTASREAGQKCDLAYSLEATLAAWKIKHGIADNDPLAAVLDRLEAEADTALGLSF